MFPGGVNLTSLLLSRIMGGVNARAKLSGYMSNVTFPVLWEVSFALELCHRTNYPYLMMIQNNNNIETSNCTRASAFSSQQTI